MPELSILTGTRIGIVTFWTLTQTSHVALGAELEAIGLKEFLPEPMTPAAALLNALRDQFKSNLIRQLAATLNVAKAAGCITLCLVIVERAMNANNHVPWDNKAATTGRKALASVIRCFGWNADGIKAGVIEARDLPSLEDRIAELKLAVKAYDLAQ